MLKDKLIARTSETRDSACCGDASDWNSTSLLARFEATKTPCLQSRPWCKLEKSPTNTTITAGRIPGLLRLWLCLGMIAQWIIKIYATN